MHFVRIFQSCPSLFRASRLYSHRSSVTRFGEISPLWQNCTSLWQFFEGFLIFGKIVNLLCQHFYSIGQKLIVVKGQIVKELIWPSGHTASVLDVTLLKAIQLVQSMWTQILPISFERLYDGDLILARVIAHGRLRLHNNYWDGSVV